MTATLPPAGWYPDPAGSGGQAWWNGTSWGAPLSPPEERRKVCSGVFGGKAIEVYSDGTVRVAGFVMRKSVPFQKLISIEYSANVEKKSAIGRGAVAVMTGGANLIGSNKRGDVFLTIVTDEKVYSLHEGTPNALTMKSALGLAAAGQGVL